MILKEELLFDPEKFTTYADDMQVIEDIFEDYTLADICSKMDLSETDYLAIKHGEIEPTKQQLENIYNFAYNKGLYLNEIKWGECVDEFQQGRTKVGSHGSRVNIKGNIRLDVSGESNDFADGFYVGQHISQAGMFVGEEPNSSLYILTFNTEDLDIAAFNVGVDWMLAVAYYRNKIPQYADHPKIRAIRDKVDNCDYVFGPIADNKIFEVIDAFTEGLITDQQCLYALSATHLGYQYVLKTQKALEHLEMKEHLYYCAAEKAMYNKESDVETNTSMNKALIAKKRYADRGQYITELLSDNPEVNESLITEQTLDRTKVLDIGLSLGAQFIKHFDKVYNDTDEGTMKHHAREMQTWYDKVKNLVWKHNKKKLSKTDLIDIFFTVGSTPDTYLDNDTEIEVYEDFYLDLLNTDSVQESLRKLNLLNESLTEEAEADKIRWWYDRSSKSWIVQVLDRNGFEIENEYCGNSDWLKASVEELKDRYEITDARKYKPGE